MEPVLKFGRHWGAPAAAVVFFSLWCVAEAGRMSGVGPDGVVSDAGLFSWSGTWPLVLTTLAIGVAVWQPVLSLGLVAALLAGQLAFFIPAMYANHWPIYFGSFIALAFIVWTANRRIRIIAGLVNLLFAAVMAFLMISWRYGGGVGWLYPMQGGDSYLLGRYGWQVFSVLALVAAALYVIGLLLALYQERGHLFRSREQARNTLKETEIDLIVEQERTRIARDLHDVLAHSLAVIAAQADGTRYLSSDQPKPVLNALENIAGSARTALVDAQRVIEGVRDDNQGNRQPRLSDIKPLLDGMQGSLKIRTTEAGTPVPLSDGQQVAVFRIVQECLTNALKHGGRGTAVRAHFDWSGPGLTLHVASAATNVQRRKQASDEPERPGRGLPGMRERAHLAGGWLSAGPDGEEFRVAVFIPYLTEDDPSANEDELGTGESVLTGKDGQIVPAASTDTDRD
jgi:signal transduction histidine kinase